MGLQAYQQSIRYSTLPPFTVYSQPVPVQPQYPQAALPTDQWQSDTVKPMTSRNKYATNFYRDTLASLNEKKEKDHGSRPRGFLRPLEPDQEIPDYLRAELNPLQRMGVWMIENLYQRIGLKQDIWGTMHDNGVDVCMYMRRAHQLGIHNWQSCSQYTKMAIVRDGFFVGCIEGAIRMMTEPFPFFINTPGAERFIDKHSRIIMPESDNRRYSRDSYY